MSAGAMLVTPGVQTQGDFSVLLLDVCSASSHFHEQVELTPQVATGLTRASR